MDQKRTIDGKIERALESLDGVQRAIPQPWFYTRVKARLQREEKTVWETIGSFLSKPAIAMTALTAVLMLNVAILSKQSHLDVAPVVSQAVQITDSESIIASNSSFEYENLVQP